MTLDWTSLLAHAVHDVRALARKGLSNAQMLERELAGKVDLAVESRLTAITASQRSLDQLMTQLGRLVETSSFGYAALWADLQELQTVLLAAKLDQKSVLADSSSELVIGDLPECRVPSKLQAVFSELIRNAIQFRDLNLPLRISITGEQPSPSLLRVDVHDNGMGWDNAYSGKLFQPFERLNSNTGGFGLGLATARGMVEAAGGNISGEPQKQGARFRIELPLE